MKPQQISRRICAHSFLQVFVLFSNEAVHGCSIRLEGVHLGEALGVDPEGTRDRGVVVEGTKQAAAADILEGV